MPAAHLSQPKTEYGYTHWKHGNLPVYKEQNKWVVHYPDGSSREYGSGRALMRGLHNGRDPHLPVDRYFKKKQSAKKVRTWMKQDLPGGVSHPTTLDLFEIKQPEINRLRRRSPRQNPRSNPRSNPSTVSSLNNLGIDLENRSHEVRKLLFAGFGKRIVSMGYDPEDVLQEVYKGLLARNMGKCPWDATKSSFGHYVHMVCGCIVSNYHRKYNRINMNERSGVRSINDGESIEIDLAASDLCSVRGEQGDDMVEDELVQEMLLLIAKHSEDVLFDKQYSRLETSLKVVPMLVAGYKRREISKELKIREGIITRCINHIRTVCQEMFGQ